ncbi:substrate-binding domain-containing protein, partial [Klebsiella pneumoniae]|nr:substrate-binding domain-containing protein [Klebsiella pneumoniae]
GEYSYEAGYEAALRLAAGASRPEAVFFASDIMAIGGMDAFRSRGLSVPGDISAVGFNDVPLAAWPTYALTTVRHPWEQMAARV